MKANEIANIVFYKLYIHGEEVKKACVFFRDGSILKNATYEDGLKACQEVIRERNITSKDAFREMVNKDIVHVLSAEEFLERFDQFVSHNQDSKEEHSVISNVSSVPTDAVQENQSDEQNEFYEKDEFGYDDSIFDDYYYRPTLFDRIKNALSDKTVRARTFIGSLAVAAGITGMIGFVSGCSSKEGKMERSNIESSYDLWEPIPKDDTTLNEISLVRSNDNYDGYSFEQLLEVTDSVSQKRAMMNLSSFIQAFNGNFANSFVENGKGVKAALSFDEVVALQQAYNDFSREDIKAYFNGADIKADDLTNAYKMASMQLIGAYAIETKEHPVDASVLIESEEGKEFYQRYHQMFLDAKYAKGQEQLTKVKAFYDAVRKEFPITNEVRMEGTMHADSRASIEAYKLSVAPMVGAAEMMFQNLAVDYTLNDSEIDFFNDIGLCNYAQHTFERIETITLSSMEDDTNPLYEQYRSAIIKMMKEKDQYVVDDAHRELSKLDSFQKAVNGHFNEDVTTTNSTKTSTGKGVTTNGGVGTSTRTETKTWTETKTTYREEITREEKEIPADEKAKIDAQFEAENAANKAAAEAAAKEKARKLQEQADKDAKKIQEEIKQEEKDLQDKIKDANEQIEKNQDNDLTNDKPINEKDFGDHNVDFFPEYEDGNGNLGDFVENITTDPTGDQTGKDLPDPNVTGAEFDSKANSYNSNNNATVTETSNQTFIEYEEPVIEFRVIDEEPVISQPIVEEESPVQYRIEESSNDNTFVDEVITRDMILDEAQGEVEFIDDNNWIEYPEDFEFVFYDGDPFVTNEELVNDYVEAMANEESQEEAYQYSK